jgi:hypothetical protein
MNRLVFAEPSTRQVEKALQICDTRSPACSSNSVETIPLAACRWSLTEYICVSFDVAEPIRATI